MLRIELGNSKDTRPLHVVDIKPANEPVLVTENLARIHGTFKSASRSSAGTTIISQPKSGGAICLTDLIVSTDKVNGASVTVRFTDGTNTINISQSVVTDAPANFGIGFIGNWQGWKDARVELVTVNSVSATVAIGYYKILEGLEFSQWDSLR